MREQEYLTNASLLISLANPILKSSVELAFLHKQTERQNRVQRGLRPPLPSTISPPSHIPLRLEQWVPPTNIRLSRVSLTQFVFDLFFGK